MTNGENRPVNPFAERFAKNTEARIEADKIKNTHDNAVDLVKNNDVFFGSDDEEKKSEIVTRVFSRFNRTPPYTDFNSMVEASNNTSKNQRIAFGDIDSLTESVKIVMDMSVLGTNLVTSVMTAEQIDENLPKEMEGIGKKIKEKSLMNHTNDELSKINNVIEQNNLFNTQNKVARGEVYKRWGEEVKLLPEASYVRKYVEVARSIFEDLGIEVVDASQNTLDKVVEKIDVIVDTISESTANGFDQRALIDNPYAKDSKEFRSPYELDFVSFVDCLFNQISPYLRLTPPPEWVRKLSSKEQYLLNIEQKLANGAEYKLKTKNISADKARQNEVYDLKETELKLLYEMPGMKEALETFVGDLFERASEDGRMFLRLKLCKDNDWNLVSLSREEINKGTSLVTKDGYLLKMDKYGNLTHILDPAVARKCGDMGSNFGFENYKEEMFKKMALRKLYPSKEGEISNDWEKVYKDTIKNYIQKTRSDFEEKSKKVDNRTDAELEHKWIKENALLEKAAVATAWNLLFVGNIIESADTTRSLKPSQINSDKIRTMMMPLEKFLQKANIRKGRLDGSEEFFGGSLALWAKRRLEEEGVNFSQKLVYAADMDRNQLTDEEAQWRLMPKRTMCGFNDEYHVKTIRKDSNGVPVLDERGEVKKEEMTFSEALLSKSEIYFEENDLDVFVTLRDTWDEVISISPFLIGKGEFNPVQQPEKFASAVEKLRGLITGINKVRLSPQEATRQGRLFGHEKYVDCPEFYAWLIANSIGLEIDMDVPVLTRKALNKDAHYFIGVSEVADTLALDSKTLNIVRRILTADGYLDSKLALIGAEKRRNAKKY